MRRLRRWLVVLLGLVGVAVGAFLAVNPSSSLAVLVVVVTPWLLLSGERAGLGPVRALVAAGCPHRDRLAGGRVAVPVWPGVTIGVMALAWPDVTVFVIAVVFGVRMVLFGLAQLWDRGRISQVEVAVTELPTGWPG